MALQRALHRDLRALHPLDELPGGVLLFGRGVLRDAPSPAAAFTRSAGHGGKLHLARNLRALLGIVDLRQHPPVSDHGEGLARAHQAQRIVKRCRERALLRAVVDVVGVKGERLRTLGAVEGDFALVVHIATARREQVVRELHRVRVTTLALHGRTGHTGIGLHELRYLHVLVKRGRSR